MSATATALLESFAADAPAPGHEALLAPFAPLIGSWDLDVVYHDRDGTTRAMSGEWHFGWALGGRAVADVWIAPRREERDERGEWGLTLRFWDPGIGAFRSTWLGPAFNRVQPFIGRVCGGEIVLEGAFGEGELTRWVFSDIESDSFRWRAEDSRDGGATWQLRQRMTGRRSAGPAPA